MTTEEKTHKWMNGELENEKIENTSELQKISHYTKYIQMPKADVNLALQQFQNRKKPKKTIHLKLFYKIVASLLLLIAPAYYLYTINSTVSTITQIAQTTFIDLPDASQVRLSANSKLEYSKTNWNNNRLLILKGEAYFKVKKGEKFTVKTKLGNIEVLGTQFNVKQRNEIFEVVCYKGSVKVASGKKTEVLQPGNVFQIINNKKTTYTKTEDQNPSWIQKESSFKNTPLEYVIDELENYYAVNIQLKNVNHQQLFTGAFTHTNIDIALKTITESLDIQYKKTKKNIIFFK